MLRVSLLLLLAGVLVFFLLRFAGGNIIQWTLSLLTYYKFLAISAVVVALSSEFHYLISLWEYGVKSVKTNRTLRVTLWIMLLGIPCLLYYKMTGDRFLHFILLFTPEYTYMTVTAIIAFFILHYVYSKNEYENLDVFGSVLLIIWVSIFVLGFSLHLAVHFKLFEKAIGLFEYLNRVLPGAYKSLPYIILASWIINFFALIYVTGRRISNILIDHIEKKIRSSYQEKIIELIYDDSTEGLSTVEELQYFKKVKRLFFTRQLFSDELLRMHEIVYGSLLERINQLFNSLLLKDDAYNYLHSRRWFYKIKGLRIYAELGDKSEITYIEKLIHSKNFVLRFEAQLAMTRLSEEAKPLHYLKRLEEKLTVWEQLNLIYFYTNHQKPVGDLSGLLDSPNISVICFGLQCIRKFNKVEYRSRIMELTRHDDWEVQNAAYQTLGLYDEAEISSYILSRYDQTLIVSTRIIMIRSLGLTGDQAAIPFLKQQLLSVVSDEICIELFRALIQIDSVQATTMATSDYFKFMRLYEHVKENLK